jgi:hypothetical protein
MDELKRCPDCAEQVQREARKCRFCGYLFEVQPSKLAQSAQNSSAKNNGCLLGGLLLGAILLVGYCSSDSDTSTNQATATEKSTRESPTSQTIDPYHVRLQREVDSLKKKPTLTDIPATKDEMLMALVLIGGRVKIYQDAPSKLTPQDEEVRADFRRLQSAYQTDAFPKLRKAQAQILDRLLWEQDVRVSASGDRSRSLKFTGAIFASNKGIKVAQENMGDTIEMLRFKQVRYEWYSGSEYQYYSYEPLDDGKLANFVYNRWVAI